MTDTLEAHLTALDLTDERSRGESEAYRSLIHRFRPLAAELGEVASQMAGYRDLPMGRHEAQALAAPPMREAFERFVTSEEALLELLRLQVIRHRNMGVDE